MLTVGLTGQIASGKSTVASILRHLGAAVISGDAIGKEVVESDPRILRRLCRMFGTDILKPDGSLDRRAVAKIAFADPKRTAELNNVVHPALLRALRRELRRTREHTTCPILVVDAALIFEWNIDCEFDLVVLVETPRQKQLKRLVSQGLSELEARQRIRRQMPKYQQRLRADIILRNDGSLTDLRKKARSLYQRLLRQTVDNFD